MLFYLTPNLFFSYLLSLLFSFLFDTSKAVMRLSPKQKDFFPRLFSLTTVLAFSLKVVVCAFCQSEHSQPLQDGLARCRATARDDMDDWCAGRGWNYKPRCHVRKGLKDNSEHFRKMPSFNLISKVNRESAYQIRRCLLFFFTFSLESVVCG